MDRVNSGIKYARRREYKTSLEIFAASHVTGAFAKQKSKQYESVTIDIGRRQLIWRGNGEWDGDRRLSKGKENGWLLQDERLYPPMEEAIRSTENVGENPLDDRGSARCWGTRSAPPARWLVGGVLEFRGI